MPNPKKIEIIFFLLKNPKVLSIIGSTLTGAKSARNVAKTKVGGVKIELHFPVHQGDN